MERVGGRAAWLPAHLVATPLLLAGAWFLAGIDVSTTKTGDAESVVRMVFPSPASWFADVGRASLGIGLLVVGLAAWIAARWRPNASRVPLTVTRFASFGVAAFVLAVLGGFAFFDLSAHVFEASTDGLHWRYLLGVRGHVLDQVVAWSAWAGALACYVLSYGPSWRSFKGRPAATGDAAAI